MQRITCSTRVLPARLDAHSRFLLWRDIYMAEHGRLDFARSEDVPFSLRFAFSQYGGIGVGQFDGAFSRVTRSARRISEQPSDTFCLVVNLGGSRVTCTHRQRDLELEPGGMVLFCDAEEADLWGPGVNRLTFLPIPSDRLFTMVAGADDLAGRPLRQDGPAARHLRRYLELLEAEPEVGRDARVAEHVGTTLLDLVALTLGCDGNAGELAQSRGLRAARLQDITARIRSECCDPGFSARRVATALGLSTRYVQDLLHADGQSFTERVLELRLQHARKMLSDTRHDRLRVSEIAYACGFNEVSYFNRCYRRRFGAAPLDHRARDTFPAAYETEGRTSAPSSMRTPLAGTPTRS